MKDITLLIFIIFIFFSSSCSKKHELEHTQKDVENMKTKRGEIISFTLTECVNYSTIELEQPLKNQVWNLLEDFEEEIIRGTLSPAIEYSFTIEFLDKLGKRKWYRIYLEKEEIYGVINSQIKLNTLQKWLRDNVITKHNLYLLEEEKSKQKKEVFRPEKAPWDE